MNDRPIISVRELIVRFGSQPVLQNLDLDIKAGEKILITGPSGCGKSTILNTLLGTISPPDVVSAQLKLFSGNYTDYRSYRRNSVLGDQVGIVFQDAMHSLNPYRTIPKQFKNNNRELVSNALTAINLDQRRFLNDENPVFVGRCSGGELQRLSLMHSILLKKKLILLDEPLTDIDLISRKKVIDALKPLMEDPDLAVILVSHEFSWVPDYFLHLELHNGQLSPMISQKEKIKPFGEEKIVKSKGKISQNSNIEDKHAKRIFSLELKKPIKISNSFSLLAPSLLTVTEGKHLGILGESGSGKSTIMRLAAGLQDFPRESGAVKLICPAGNLLDLSLLKRRERSGRIQIVFQDTTGSAFGNRKLVHGFKDAAKVRRVTLDILCKTMNSFAKKIGLIHKNVGLAEIFNRKFDEFSIGQRRRIALLMAISHLKIYSASDARVPKLLLLDEPSRGLDKVTKGEVIEALSEFCKKFNITMVTISHDLEFLYEFCLSFRFVLDGLILPSTLNRDDMLMTQKQGSLPGINNPYYHEFLSQEEPERKGGLTNDSRNPGCILDRIALCSYKSENQCQYHNTLIANGEIGICS